MEQVQTIKYGRVSLLSIAILIVLVWGFYRTYIMFFPSFDGFTFVQHFHGAIMLSWMAILIIQPLLISRKKNNIHRSVGKLSYVLAPILMVSIFMVSRMTYHRELNASAPLSDAVAGISLSIPGLIIFGILYGLAISNTRRTYNHMRYMIGTALLMIGPGLGRGLIIYFEMPPPTAISMTLVIIALIGIVLLVVDLAKKQNYVPNLVVALLLAFQVGIWELRYHKAWQAFGETFANLLF